MDGWIWTCFGLDRALRPRGPRSLEECEKLRPHASSPDALRDIDPRPRREGRGTWSAEPKRRREGGGFRWVLPRRWNAGLTLGIEPGDPVKMSMSCDKF